MYCSLPGSSVHRIFQARILEWAAMPSSRGSSWPKNRIGVAYLSCIVGGFFTTSATWEAPAPCTLSFKMKLVGFGWKPQDRPSATVGWWDLRGLIPACLDVKAPQRRWRWLKVRVASTLQGGRKVGENWSRRCLETQWSRTVLLCLHRPLCLISYLEPTVLLRNKYFSLH